MSDRDSTQFKSAAATSTPLYLVRRETVLERGTMLALGREFRRNGPADLDMIIGAWSRVMPVPEIERILLYMLEAGYLEARGTHIQINTAYVKSDIDRAWDIYQMMPAFERHRDEQGDDYWDLDGIRQIGQVVLSQAMPAIVTQTREEDDRRRSASILLKGAVTWPIAVSPALLTTAGQVVLDQIGTPVADQAVGI
ncbi:hypothetical protein ACEUZ9_005456 [Paracoccus litorisediminis]|uniref:hypothetical protein n=1 Tax=Paracoccus litorisediminis TaxID=2006130 RepID=UPI003731D88F